MTTRGLKVLFLKVFPFYRQFTLFLLNVYLFMRLFILTSTSTDDLLLHGSRVTRFHFELLLNPAVYTAPLNPPGSPRGYSSFRPTFSQYRCEVTWTPRDSFMQSPLSSRSEVPGLRSHDPLPAQSPCTLSTRTSVSLRDSVRFWVQRSSPVRLSTPSV